MKRTVIFVAGLLITSTGAHASNLYCAAYEAEYEKNKGKTFSDMSADYRAATTFLFGAYLAVTKQTPTTVDNADFNKYLFAVSASCKATPKQAIMDVGLQEIAKWKPRKTSRYSEISLIDLKLDIQKMAGQEIETQANVQIFGDMGMLQDGMMDANPLPLDFKKVPRDQRKKLLEQCSMGCRATVQGKVGNVMFQNGIVADAVLID